MDSDDLHNIFGGHRNIAPLEVGTISQFLANAINAQNRAVLFSWHTAQKQLREHPDLEIWEYLLIPHVLFRGQAVQDSPRTLILAEYALDPPYRLYKAALKATTTGQELLTCPP